jgi:hypothetical protein
MFNPSKDDVRRFFCEAWRKQRERAPLTPLEALAVDWITLHPEYHADLADAEAAASRSYTIDEGRTNPFLHLSLHLAIAEQLSIDHPPGIRAVFTTLVTRHGDDHAAAHQMMECLGEVVWAAQRAGATTPSDAMNERYLDCLRRLAGRSDGHSGPSKA